MKTRSLKVKMWTKIDEEAYLMIDGKVYRWYMYEVGVLGPYLHN